MNLPPTFCEKENHINAVIETPKGCGAKYNSPFTKAQDGDPLDALILLNEPSWPGCIIECKIMGMMEATEEKENKTVRNDRIIAKAIASEPFSHINDLTDMDEYLEKEIENFFNHYNNLENNHFKITSKKDALTALHLIKKQCIHANN